MLQSWGKERHLTAQHHSSSPHVDDLYLFLDFYRGMRESGFMNHLVIDLVTITFAHPPSLKLQSGLCLSTSCFHWIEIYENLVDSTQIQHHGNSSFSKYLLGTKCVPKWLKRCFFFVFFLRLWALYKKATYTALLKRYYFSYAVRQSLWGVFL